MLFPPAFYPGTVKLSASGHLARLLRRAGYTLSRLDYLPRDIDPSSAAIGQAVRPYTATPPERVLALCEAVRYVVSNGIPGDFVECGVWRGGSMMAAAYTLMECGDSSRHLYLYDTFEGVVAPGPEDTELDGTPAEKIFLRDAYRRNDSGWRAVPEAEVRDALWSTGYPRHHVHLVKGRVEDTLPGEAPSRIAVLRLDTDWYVSTRHELTCLYPRLVPGGVVLVDDYGHWRGARKAVDEYLATQVPRPLLNRIDYSARLAIVPGPFPAQSPR